MDLQEYQSGARSLRDECAQLAGLLNVPELTKEMKRLDEQAADPAFWSNPQDARAAGRRRAGIESRLEDVQSAQATLTDLEAFLELAAEDPAFLDENRADLVRLMDLSRRKIDTLRHDIYFTDPMSVKNAILSIHPGTGGVEAQDWAEMLLRMYTRWSEQVGYGVEMLNHQAGEEAGIKDAALLVSGRYAFGLLRCERGTHRLVRISPYDANRRRHTSFAAVYVLPEIDDETPIDIRPEDLRVDTYRASGAGGQHVNKTDSAVRITHAPSGLIVACQTERSQHKNRENAMRMLKAKLYDLKEQEKQKELDRLGGVKEDIGWGRQIRSYVLEPYQMVKDHRTDCETSNVTAVLDGDIESFIEAFLAAQAKHRPGG